MPAKPPKKISYTHDQMIDEIVRNPGISQQGLAEMFGYTKTWICTLMSSDGFQARLAQRRKELVDPVIVRSLEQGLEVLSLQAVGVLQEKLEANPHPDVALKILEIASRHKKGDGGPLVSINYVAVMPPKAPDSPTWEAECAPLIGPPSGD